MSSRKRIVRMRLGCCPQCGKDENGKFVKSLHGYRHKWCAECIVNMEAKNDGKQVSGTVVWGDDSRDILHGMRVVGAP